jgi:hypothetical protein
MAAPKIQITVDDRKLRDLIAKTKGPAPVRIVADGVEYGLYQEMGTVKMGGQPFMVPAVEKVRPGFGLAMKGAITRAQVEQVVEKTARDVERFAKQFAPVDTGALRNSIHVVQANDFAFEVPQ